ASFFRSSVSSVMYCMLLCARCCSKVRASLHVLDCRAATTRGVSNWSQPWHSSWMWRTGACNRLVLENAPQVRDRVPPAPSCVARRATSS
ncbi:hypothetical protein V8C86DRAFT_2824902, partial [Haematococcus lacustris]